MSVTSEEVLDDRATDDDGPILGHLYLCRIFPGRPPRIGDRALCGHVKDCPQTFEIETRRLDRCVVCVDIAEAMGIGHA